MLNIYSVTKIKLTSYFSKLFWGEYVVFTNLALIQFNFSTNNL
jgi:hypothetical protein